jgi:hypothetical protein
MSTAATGTVAQPYFISIPRINTGYDDKFLEDMNINYEI